MYTFILSTAVLVGILGILSAFAVLVDRMRERRRCRDITNPKALFCVRIQSTQARVAREGWSVDVFEARSRESKLGHASTKRDAKRLAKTIMKEVCARHGFGRSITSRYDILLWPTKRMHPLR